MQALRNTKLIAAYAIFDQRVRLLGYAVKFFAKVRTYVMYVRTYISLLVFFFSPRGEGKNGFEGDRVNMVCT